MAGVLTVSANGVETSPVTRGVWVSENIIGIQPPPPPSDVPAIEADITGATSLRNRLEKHRADKICAECHRKIDPLGFSLESFDPIGQWREKYPEPKKKGVPAPLVDASGEFLSGEAFHDFTGFKKIIRETREDLFTRHLITAFLSYGTGRLMEPKDDFIIDDILERVKKEGLGLRTLLAACLTSDVFRFR